jgi:CHAT domain-containing protein
MTLDLDMLGSRLLTPFETVLPSRIYIGSTGPLAGFPLAMIRFGGEYLAQNHTVVNVLSLGGQGGSKLVPKGAVDWSSVFLAGAPGTGRGGNTPLSGADSEVRHLARMFSGQKAHVFTGDDFQRGKFTGPEFSESDLVHIASHGRINLEYPELSRLALSPRPGRDNPEYLTPLDIRGRRLDASLVVLSACETAGLNRFSFDSNLGFVSAFLHAGVDTVVASLWPVPDQFARDFMLDFYSALLAGEAAPLALSSTRRKYMGMAKDTVAAAAGSPDWAAFQVYVNRGR